MLMYGELDEKKLAAYRQMDDAAKFRRMSDVRSGKSGISQLQKDSLWRLQAVIDSSNFVKLMGIIDRFGFPNKYIEPYKVSTILLHASPSVKTDTFFRFLMAEVADGNLPGIEYARIYDNYRYGQHLAPLYYADEVVGKDGKPADPQNMEETNKARKAIGLKPL